MYTFNGVVQELAGNTPPRCVLARPPDPEFSRSWISPIRSPILTFAYIVTAQLHYVPRASKNVQEAKGRTCVGTAVTRTCASDSRSAVSAGGRDRLLRGGSAFTPAVASDAGSNNLGTWKKNSMTLKRHRAKVTGHAMQNSISRRIVNDREHI